MAVTSSKLFEGTLTLDSNSFAVQATGVTITPARSVGDPIVTLSGDTLAGDGTRTDTLEITAVQDFDDPAGFIAFSWTADDTVVPFSWQPNASSPTYSGNVQVIALPVGGDVGSTLTADAKWTIIGVTTVTYA